MRHFLDNHILVILKLYSEVFWSIEVLLKYFKSIIPVREVGTGLVYKYFFESKRIKILLSSIIKRSWNSRHSAKEHRNVLLNQVGLQMEVLFFSLKEVIVQFYVLILKYVFNITISRFSQLLHSLRIWNTCNIKYWLYFMYCFIVFFIIF